MSGDAHALRQVGRFALGMFGIAVISALNTQMDKLVISKMLAAAMKVIT